MIGAAASKHSMRSKSSEQKIKYQLRIGSCIEATINPNIKTVQKSVITSTCKDLLLHTKYFNI